MSEHLLLAPLLQSYFRRRLTKQRNATSATLASYRDALRMLILFTAARLQKKPAALASNISIGTGLCLFTRRGDLPPQRRQHPIHRAPFKDFFNGLLEDVQQAAACTEASQDETAPEGRAERARKRRNNRGALPAHLPRIEIVVDIDDKICPCCKGDLHQIGEDKSERLDMVPAQFRVVVTRRPKYACRACEDGVLQAEAPARLIEGGLPTKATVAQVLVSK